MIMFYWFLLNTRVTSELALISFMKLNSYRYNIYMIKMVNTFKINLTSMQYIEIIIKK